MSRETSRPRRKQDRDYWDRMAGKWDDEIFNTLHHDKFKVIPAELKRSSRGARSVADFGCGVGIYLPVLGRLFDEVHGFERSRACVAIARENVKAISNVAVHQAASAPSQGQARFDVVLCVNVAIHPSLHARTGVLRSVRAMLSDGGRLILVVPSFESATMVALAERSALKDGAEGDWDARSQANGVVLIEGLPTKHYTRDELRGALVDVGFKVSRINRVEYSWRSQGVRPTAALRGSLPWDWIAVAQLPAGSARGGRAIAA